MTFMQFVDILSLSYHSRKYSPRVLVACVMYLIIGGKDIMCAFQIEYREMYQVFQEQFPIIHPQEINNGSRLPEGILFYNQIIQPFFNNEFGFFLHDLIEPIKYVLRYFILDIHDSAHASPGLIQQCKFIMHQQSEIALEKFVQMKEQGYYPNMIIRPNPHPTFQDYTDDEVYQNVSEFFSYQTYNSQSLDTLKFLGKISDNSEAKIEHGSISNSISQAAASVDTCAPITDTYDLSQPRVISVTSDMSITNC